MEENSFLIARLKKLMEGKSNRVFAKECGISETVIRKILKGDDPNLSTLKKIAEAKKVEVWWFFTDLNQTGDPTVPATIGPGNEKQRKRIIDQSKRPTIANFLLRWIVEWMDDYYGKYPEQSTFLCDELKRIFPSFKAFYEKKQTSGDLQGKLSENKYVNGK